MTKGRLLTGLGWKGGLFSNMLIRLKLSELEKGSVPVSVLQSFFRLKLNRQTKSKLPNVPLTVKARSVSLETLSPST